MYTAILHLLLTSQIGVLALPTSAEIFEMVKRDIQAPFGGLPGCDDSDDPTWAFGKSEYQDRDGIGTSIGVDCNEGHSDDHCWTEYFAVETSEEYQPWKNLIGDIYCDAEDLESCTQAIGSNEQQCETFTWSVSESIEASFSFKGLGSLLTGIGVTMGASATQEHSKQTCSTQLSEYTCSWRESGCHSIWGSQLVTYIHGYTSRVCISPTSDPNANMPNTEPTVHGEWYKRGMKDFKIPLAGRTVVTCGGECSATYNGPPALPPAPNGGVRKPWVSN